VKKGLLIVLVFVAFLFAAEKDSEVIATVNGEKITAADLMLEFQFINLIRLSNFFQPNRDVVRFLTQQFVASYF
jgi:hypothetical protein